MVGICRLCAALRKMDVLTTITDTNHMVCRKLRECCQIDIRLNDTLPKCICCDCIEALQQFHSFYVKVHESQESLATLFPPVVRLTNVNTLNSAKSLTLAESLASVIHFTANNEKETETSTDAECFGNDKELKTEVHVAEEKKNSEEYETPMVLDENEVNLMLDKVEEEIDDEVYLIEKILGRKCGAENEEEISCHVPLTATTNSLDAHELKKSALLDINPDTHELPAGPTRSAAIHDVDIETDHIISSEIEEVIEEEVAEEVEEEILEEERIEETVLEEEREQDEAKEQAPIQIQLSSQDANEIQLDNWNAYPWLCYLCSAEESSFIDLQMHFTVAHDLHSCDEMQFKCVDCLKVCSRYYSFVNHVRFRHRAPLTLCCDVCNTICIDFKQLAVHRQEQHAKNKDYPIILLCSDCGHGFKNRNSRQIHSKIHARKEKKFECTDCGKRFASNVAWKAHQKVHSDIKEFSCEQCGKSFRQKNNLSTHVLTHEGEKPYECSTCLKTFKTTVNLETHIKSHSSIKKFKCDYCENMFRSKDAKLSHERTHTGEKPFKCEYCERSFRFRSTFLGHMNTHTGLRPYSCEPCNHHFTNWSNYNKHMQRCHGNKPAAATDERKKRRGNAKDKTSNSNEFFEYEVLDEIVDSPEPVLHEDATYAMCTESVNTNTSRVIEFSTISTSNSENRNIVEHFENINEA